MTPPIVRTRKAGLRGGMGDTFWYLEDKTYASPLPCGYGEDSQSEIEIPNANTTFELDLDSLQLNIDFENFIESDNIVKDNSKHNRSGQLHNAQIKTGGFSRNYKNVLLLDNNQSTSEDRLDSFVTIENTSEDLKLVESTFSFWIRPLGLSSDNAGIIMNNSTDINGRHGIVLNPNGNYLSLGCALDKF